MKQENTFNKITVAAPGSVMLLGEHAVLHGYPAVVVAINQYIRVHLLPRSDQQVFIHSKLLGTLETSLIALKNDFKSHAFRFVLAAVRQLIDAIPNGFELDIQSDFSDQLGFGSSAAVTVATIGALHQWLFERMEMNQIFEAAFSVIQQVQGVGSGADVAASTYGGVLAYYPHPLQIQSIDAEPKLHLIYSGYKTPTVEVIQLVEKKLSENPKCVNALFRKIGIYTQLGARYLGQSDWGKLGRVFSKHYEIQKALGVSDAQLDHIVRTVRQCPSVYGAKISGAGLGDCVVVLGCIDKTGCSERLSEFPVFSCDVSDTGCYKL